MQQNGLNWYIYADNAPLWYVDPTGLWNEDSRWYKPWTWFNKPESDDYEVPGTVEGLSLTLDLTPVVGDAKGFIEAFTGYDSLTHERLTWIERGLGLIFLSELRGLIKGTSSALRVADKGSVKQHPPCSRSRL